MYRDRASATRRVGFQNSLGVDKISIYLNLIFIGIHLQERSYQRLPCCLMHS